MSAYRVVPLDPAVARQVRESRTDPIYGSSYAVREGVAGPQGYGPCRQCLRKFRPDERRLLFLYNPFGPRQGDFAGLVFVHAEECRPYDADAGFPAELEDLPLVLRAYGPTGGLVEEALPAAGMDAEIRRLLALPQVAALHVRNHEARCFVARVERRAAA